MNKGTEIRPKIVIGYINDFLQAPAFQHADSGSLHLYYTSASAIYSLKESQAMRSWIAFMEVLAAVVRTTYRRVDGWDRMRDMRNELLAYANQQGWRL